MQAEEGAAVGPFLVAVGTGLPVPPVVGLVPAVGLVASSPYVIP